MIANLKPGEILTDVTARGKGYGLPFKGRVDRLSDLEDLVVSAGGVAGLDLHRGHSPIESVLEKFLGISHQQMHINMERDGLNLAGAPCFSCGVSGFCKRLTMLVRAFKATKISAIAQPHTGYEKSHWRLFVRILLRLRSCLR